MSKKQTKPTAAVPVAGSNGGQFMAITFPDGTQMGDVTAPASANAGAGPER